MKIVNVVLLVVLFALAGCRSEAELATLTANAPEPTPTAEVWTAEPATATLLPSPPTPTPLALAPRAIVSPHNLTDTLVMSPACAGDSCQIYIEQFAGTVGVTSDWTEGRTTTCYALSASAILDVHNNNCENAVEAYEFIAFIHYGDGTITSYNTLPMRSGALDDINGKYNLAWGILLVNDGWVYPEVALNVKYTCSGHGNNVIISDVWFRPAPDLGWCSGMESPG